jgi:hypothetical protein
LLLMLVLGGVEQLTDDAVVQIDDPSPWPCPQGRAPPALHSVARSQTCWRHLTTLAGNLEQTVLVNLLFTACGQVERLQGLEALDVLQDMP